MPSVHCDGSYETVEHVRDALAITVPDHDPLILSHLLAASRAVEEQCRRHFFPVTATNYYRWPGPYDPPPQRTWPDWPQPGWGMLLRLRLGDDLLSVDTLTAGSSGQNAVPIPLTHYFLEPQQYGPPYAWLELDQSYGVNIPWGAWPQRNLAVTGMWGYCADSEPAGTLAAPLGATDTTLTLVDSLLVGQGDVLLCETEQFSVGSPHPPGTALPLTRGIHGTTAAAHASGTPVARLLAPADIRRLVRAKAIATFQQDLAAWGRAIGAGDAQAELQGTALAALSTQICAAYRRNGALVT